MKVLSVFFGAVVLSACLLVTTHTYANENETTFKSVFINNTYTQMKVVIRDDSRTIEKTKSIGPGKTYKHPNYIGCKKVRTHTFAVLDEQSNTVVGSGKYTITGGKYSSKKNACVDEIYNFDTWSDDNDSDVFGIACTYITSSQDGRNRNGTITISSNSN